MTVKEIKEAITKGGHQPSDVFGEDALKGDPTVQAFSRAEKQSEYEHAKRLEKKLGEEREARNTDQKTAESEAAKYQQEILAGRSKSTLAELSTERKLDAKQQAFVEKNFGRFTSEAKDEAGLKADLNKFLDTQIDDYKGFVELVTGESAPKGDDDKGGVKGAGSGDGNDADPDGDLSNSKNNDFIPSVPGQK